MRLNMLSSIWFGIGIWTGMWQFFRLWLWKTNILLSFLLPLLYKDFFFDCHDINIWSVTSINVSLGMFEPIILKKNEIILGNVFIKYYL